MGLLANDWNNLLQDVVNTRSDLRFILCRWLTIVVINLYIQAMRNSLIKWVMPPFRSSVYTITVIMTMI